MGDVAKLFDGHILNKSNDKVNLNDQKYQGKVIGLYFSAHWCPPCRRFTPVLTEFYKKYAEEKQFEVIFISSDEDKESFDDYYKEMPWLTLDYEQRKMKEKLSDKFSVSGIPTLILLDGDSGDVICTDAREQIQNQDTQGKDFPWKNQEKKSSKNCCLLM